MNKAIETLHFLLLILKKIIAYYMHFPIDLLEKQLFPQNVYWYLKAKEDHKECQK